MSSLALVTAAFLILAVSTASPASFAVVTLASAIIVVSTFPVPIAVTPALVIVTSPDGVTSVASLEALPKYILPSAKVLIAVVAVST